MSYPVVTPDPGVTRQVLSESPEMMFVAVDFSAGAFGKQHSHHHVQATYVKSGRFTVTLDGVEHDLGPGDSLVIPSNVTHGCTCVEGGDLIDAFTPRRADFL